MYKSTTHTNTTYDFSNLHERLIQEGVFRSSTSALSANNLSEEDLKKWRRGVLSLDVPKTVMNATLKLEKLPSAGVHLYFESGTIKNYQQWHSKCKRVKWMSNVILNNESTDIAAKSFYSKLSAFEKSHFKPSSRKASPIIFNTFKIMLPTDFKVSRTSISSFASFIMSRIGTCGDSALPYFTAIEVSGRCTYLWIFTTERFYSQDGILVESKYAHDIYKDAKNHICSSTTEDATLFAKAGTVYKTEISDFSRKTRCFSNAGSKALKNFVHRFKAAMLSYFQAHHFNADRTLMLPRLNYRKYRRGSRKYKVLFVLNSYFRELEKAGSMLLDGLYALDMVDEMPRVCKQFNKIRKTLAESMRGTYHEYGKPWKYEITALMNPDVLTHIMDEVATRYLQSITALQASVFGIID